MTRLSSPEGVTCWVFSDQYALILSIRATALGRRAQVTLLDAAGPGAWALMSGAGRHSLTEDTMGVRGRAGTITLRREDGSCRLFGSVPRFQGDEEMLFDLRVSGPARGNLLPANEAAGPALPRWTGPLRAEGRAELGGAEYLLAPAHSFAMMEETDGETGSPAARTAVAAGWVNGAPAALVLGGETEASMLIFGGRQWTLRPPDWQTPDPGANGAAAQGPWRITGKADAWELTFEPLAEQHRAARRLLQRHGAETLIFGRFSGFVALENGRKIPVRRLAGAIRLWRGGSP